MSVNSEIIGKLISESAPKIAVVFMGRTGPRLLGTLSAAPSALAVRPMVDEMLFQSNLVATNISIAECRNRAFVVAHG